MIALQSPAIVSPVDTAIVVVAPLPDGALRGWRRFVQSVAVTNPSAYGLVGQPLSPGGAYLLQHGAIVVTQDTYEHDRHIRILRAHPGGLELLKEWRQKAALGARVVKATAKLMPSTCPIHAAVPVAGVVNRFPGRCYRCGEYVPGGAGNVIRFQGANRITHTDRCLPWSTPMR